MCKIAALKNTHEFNRLYFTHRQTPRNIYQ